jgi:lysophospholipase L1-like esterase
MNQRYTIVCFGDSTTDENFVANEEYLPHYKNLKVYSHWLQDELPHILGRDVQVVNSGVSGDTTLDAKMRFKQDVLNHNPDLVIIQLGVNDQCIRQDYGLSVPMVDLGAFCYNMLFFVNRCRSLAGASVILMTPGLMLWNDNFRSRFFEDPYDHSDRYGINNHLKDYADKVRFMAQNEELPLVDIFQLQYDYDQRDGCQLEDFLNDGLHPNNKAQEFIAQAILKKIKDIKTSLI